VKRVTLVAVLAVSTFSLLRLAGASAAQVVTWKGNGLDSIVPCEEGETAYLHWVLTPGGAPVEGTTAELVVGGVDQGQMSPIGNSGALQLTAGYPTGGPTSAEADITAGSVTDRAVLTISDGCRRDAEPSPSPSPEPNPSDSPTPNPEPSPTPSETATPPADAPPPAKPPKPIETEPSFTG
jgi:hypothetical protein